MSKPKAELDSIASAAEAAEAIQSVDPEVRIDLLEGKLAAIEPLLEQVQANAAMGTALTNYVSDLRAEQRFFNRARYGVACVAVFIVVIITALLGLAIFHAGSPLLKAPPAVVAAFVIAMLSGMVFMVTTVAKGVFRTTVERHADGFLPPALEKAAELADKVLGKS